MQNKFEIDLGAAKLAGELSGTGEAITTDIPFRHLDDLAAVLDHHGINDAVICGC